MNYDAMSDRELDKEVHLQIFGGKLTDKWADVPPYSSAIHRAFDVVEAMRERGFDEVDIRSWHGGWLVTFWDGTLDGGIGENDDALSLPRAIVIAALRALGGL